MRILVLGGTQFVGRHTVDSLVSAGHAVSVFNRGRTADALPPEVERLRGDRDQGTAGLAALAGRTWDVCVDVSGIEVRQVRASTELLRGRVGRYVYISAVSVYGDVTAGPVDESFPRVPPVADDVSVVDQETYNRSKATGERIVQEVYGERCAVLRPQVVAGALDPHDRFSYWVRRAGQGGEMLAPGDGRDHLQVIDARDVGQFVRVICEESLGGVFNLAGHRTRWDEFMKALGARDVVWVPEDVIRAAGVTENELPLYRRVGTARSGLMDVDNTRAVAAGLRVSAVRETIERVRGWLPECGLEPALSREREAELIVNARRIQLP